MRRIPGGSRATPLALVAALALASAASADPVGFIASMRGDVQLDAAAGGSWQAARRDGPVSVGDALRTGPDAAVKIVLVDDTLLQIDEETELVIETFHVGAAATREHSILRQTRGRLRATVGDAFGTSTKLQVHTPTAAVGVKGTDFEVRKGTYWEACLHSGGIVVTNPFGSAEPQPGQCVYAYGDKKPGDPFPNPQAPFSVEDPGDVTTSDFREPVRADVAADGDGDGIPDPPNGDPNDPSDLDQYEPTFALPEGPSPPVEDDPQQPGLIRLP